MNIYLKDIKDIGWLSSAILNTTWGKSFLNLRSGNSFVFNYDLMEADSSIKVFSADSVVVVNDNIYKNLKAAHVGYMREPFDSKNYLFFSLLKSACKKQDDLTPNIHEFQDRLVDLFVGYKSYDISQSHKNLKNNIIGSMPVTSRIDFTSAIGEYFINKNPVNGICMIYELIDQFVRAKSGKTIYGELLTKVVRAVVNPNGGLIPEMAGSTMRYMIIGEVAANTIKASEKGAEILEQLQKAKNLIRGNNTPYDTYLETGWYFNKFDGKWRMKVDDESFQFKLPVVSQPNGEYFLLDDVVTTRSQNESIATRIVGGKTSVPELIAQEGYHAKIGDYISYDDVFKLYPELPSLYSFLSANVLRDANYSFYFSPSEPKSLVLVYGKRFSYQDIEDLKYTALHEIQHYVQNVEGFGSGGNLDLANILTVSGGESTKLFITSVSAFQKRFSDVCTLIPLEEYSALITLLKWELSLAEKSLYRDKNDIQFKEWILKKRINPQIINGVYYPARFVEAIDIYRSVVDRLELTTRNITSINTNSGTFSLTLLMVYSLIDENKELILAKQAGEEILKEGLKNGFDAPLKAFGYAKGSGKQIIGGFIDKHIGKEYLELFNLSLTQTQTLIYKEVKMSNEGWTAHDLYMLNFQLYESLLGEIEARFTQQTTRIPKPLLNYFDFYTSETIDVSRLGVINDSVVANGNKKCVAALETKDDKYIIHLPDDLSNSINLLHETGHILFDFLKVEAHALVSANPEIPMSEEYFCDSFVDYIQRKGIDPMLTKDLDKRRKVQNFTYFDEIFDKALFSNKKEIDERGLILRLEFVNKMF